MRRGTGVLSVIVIAVLLAGAVRAETLLFATQDFPPFTYLVDGRPSGPGVEIVVTACRMEGLDCRIESLPWPRALMHVRHGEGDALFLLGKTNDREEWLWFSPSLIHTGYSFFERADAAILERRGLEGLGGSVVGVYGPSNTAKCLNELRATLSDPFAVDMTSDDEEAFKKLSWGRIDAVFSNRAVGKALLGKLNLKNVIPTLPYEGVDYYIGYARDSAKRELLRRFNDRIRQMQESGVVKRIFARYYLDAAAEAE